MQCPAFLSGASRLGMCITGALLCGYRRTYAVKIALLTALPALAGAVVVKGPSEIAEGDIIYGSIASCTTLLTSLIVIRYMMKKLQHGSFTPIVIYRLLLGACLVLFAFK